MAEVTPNRVKSLFSSFLSKLIDTSPETSSKRNDEANELDEAGKDTECLLTTNEARNRTLYYERVETYSALTWFAKPIEVSALVCARYGWVNTDADMLQCVHCKAFLCGTLPKHVDAHSYKESFSKLQKALKESHSKECKWLFNPSPESYAHVPLHNKEELISDFLYRVVSLNGVDTLTLDFSSINKEGITEDELRQMVTEVQTGCRGIESVTNQAAILALCGWTVCEYQVNVLQCLYCRCKIGLWNYKSDSIDSPSSATSGNDAVDCVQNVNNSSDEASKLMTTSVCNGGGESIDKAAAGDSELTDPCQEKTTVASSTPRDNSSGDASLSIDGPQRKKLKIVKQGLNPLAEHKYWCPWIQIASHTVQYTSSATCDSSSLCSQQNGDQAVPLSPPVSTDGSTAQAWLSVARILSHTADGHDFSSQMKKSPHVDSLRHLRRVLHDCKYPE